MESMVAAGKCKNIGVSNFTKEQLDHLCSVAKIPPAVNQVELHPYFQQNDLMAHCEKAGSESNCNRPSPFTPGTIEHMFLPGHIFNTCDAC